MMKSIFNKLYGGAPLTVEESDQLFTKIAAGSLKESELAGALIAMKMRGESPEEIAGAAKAFLAVAKPFPKVEYPFADIVGTGGDGTNTVNISTASALVAASCGVKVAKHGNRSVSSLTGSSDLLQALGINLELTPEKAKEALDQHDICFLFAPHYHPGFKYAAQVRGDLKTRTLFNMLGPLTNPARPKLALMGVYAPELTEPLAETAKILGYERVMVVHGAGMDEVALHGETKVTELHEGEIKSYFVSPTDFGLNEYPLELLKGGDAEDNRRTLITLLSGNAPEAHEHAVVINVAMLLKLFGNDDLKANAKRALNAIKEGSALRLLEQLTGQTLLDEASLENARCRA